MLLKRFNDLQQLIDLGVYTNQRGEIDEEEVFIHCLEIFLQVKAKKKKVYLIGNGGSAGIASHTSVDLINGCKIPAFTFYDSNVMTCLSNDYGYEEIFARPLDLCMDVEDILIAISSSGKSENILRAVRVAKEKGAFILTLSGFHKENPLRKLGHLNYWLGSEDYGLVEMGHFCFLHTLTDYMKEQISLHSDIVYA